MGNTIIEINGKRYDARSGDLLGESQQKAIQAQKASHRGRAVDGFIAPTMKQQHAHASHTPTSHAKTTAKPVPQKKRAPGIHASAPKPQKAQTLMRHAVNKPVAPHKPAVKAQAPAEMVVKKSQLPAPSLKLAAHQVNHPRLARARRHPQSQQVARFNRTQQNHPVASNAPALQAAAGVSPRRDYTQTTTTRGHAVHSGSHQTTRTTASTTHVVEKKPHVDIFEAAIANARSHEQPHHKPKAKAHRRIINVMSGVFALLLLGGFFTFANMANIEMRVASMKAGFSAQLPGYSPVGYALDGGVNAADGVVATTYRSGSSAYTLQQQVSDWDSNTLLDNIVTASSDSYKTVESQGRTIYLYGDNAAWVDGGVLYSIKGDGSITPKEISSIASSM